MRYATVGELVSAASFSSTHNQFDRFVAFFHGITD
jgi:hypothetical protein